jgi:hypothetical protein
MGPLLIPPESLESDKANPINSLAVRNQSGTALAFVVARVKSD